MSNSAEAPKPPDDLELKNIIDKLAQFVARNGPEFENMTKQKQKDNPRFGFLFGGEHFQYYIYKVNTEQAILKKQKVQSDQNATTQVHILQHQLRESEKNLRLQYEALNKQQQAQINEAILAAQKERIMAIAAEYQMNLKELDMSLEMIQNSCSKESISTNKNWVFAQCQSPIQADIILKYLENKTKDPALSFTFKLHILYLVNDLVHNYSRKQNQTFMNVFATHVPIMFSCVSMQHGADDETTREKLEKLKSIWHNQGFFYDEALRKLDNIQETYDAYQRNLRKEHQAIVDGITQRITHQYQQYEAQHHQYSGHVQQQIATLEYSVHHRPAAHQSFGQTSISPGLPPNQRSALPEGGVSVVQPRKSRFDTGPVMPMAPVAGPGSFAPPPQSNSAGAVQAPSGPSYPVQSQSESNSPMMMMPSQSPQRMPQQWNGPQQSPYGQRMAGPAGGPYQFPPQQCPTSMQPLMSLNVSAPPPRIPHQQFPPNWTPRMGSGRPPLLATLPVAPGGMGPAVRPPLLPGGPLLACPPPQPTPLLQQQQLPQQPFPPDESTYLIPKVPYYDLPAALMVPLVDLAESSYTPLDPNKIRLPPPMAPSDRLVAAVEAFYAPPNHENPRDSEGWERLGLYEYFKAKQDAIKKKERKDHSDSDKEDKEEKTDDGKEETSPSSKERKRCGSYSSDDGSRRSRGASPEPDRQSNSRSPS